MEFLFLSLFMIHGIHKNNIVIYLFRYLYNSTLIDKKQYKKYFFTKFTKMGMLQSLILQHAIFEAYSLSV